MGTPSSCHLAIAPHIAGTAFGAGCGLLTLRVDSNTGLMRISDPAGIA
ncbi:MAG TPA: hypothetical protein VGH27_05990 [Streptosporangiaceae bacterium]